MKRFMFLVMAVIALCACSTGVGRAASLAVSGVPPTVPNAIDAIESEYQRLAAYEMADVTAGNVTDADGNVVPEAVIKQEMMRADRQARIDAIATMFEALRDWSGVEKGADPNATQDAAAKTRTEMMKLIMDRLSQAKLEAKAAQPPKVIIRTQKPTAEKPEGEAPAEEPAGDGEQK